MDMKILRESVEAERLIASAQEQAVVEGEVALPGSMRDAARILHTDAQITIGAAETQVDRLGMDGQVVFHVLYTQGDPTRIQTLEAACDFSHQMDLPDVTPRMQAGLTGEVLETTAQASGGRLLLRAVIGLGAQVLSAMPISAVRDLTGLDALRTRAQDVTLCRTVGEGQSETLLREEYELPTALGVVETLYARATPQVSDVAGGEGRAEVTGSVLLDVYHAGSLPDLPLIVTHHTMDFEQAVDLAGIQGQSLQAIPIVRDVMVSSMDAGEGRRALRAEVVLGMRVTAAQQERQTLLMDAYTLSGQDVALQTQVMPLHAQNAYAVARESGKLMMVLPEKSAPIGTVLAAFVHPTVAARERIGGRMTVEGALAVTVLYLPQESDQPTSVQKEEAFTLTFPCNLPQDAMLALTPLEVEAVGITSDRVEVRYLMQLTGAALITQPVPVVMDAALHPPAETRPGGMVLYYAQSGETLWDVAHRYRVDEAALLRINPGLEQPRADRAILVYQRG
ncbi:MAG: DUF3794 domain-containing protein [Oscillospiraceae bacterium]|nr:DUF3794 domain-containing protein [Oscillospiraceae bacterium]